MSRRSSHSDAPSTSGRSGADETMTGAAQRSSPPLVTSLGTQPPRAAQSRLLTEVEAMSTNPPDGCYAGPKGDNLYEWMATIVGPQGSPYEDGIFFVRLSIPKNYPFSPPKATFMSRIYHWCIDAKGTVCLDMLCDEWNPSITIESVLIAIRALMMDFVTSSTKDALVPSIAKQYESNRQLFWKTAQEWTRRYAS